MIIAIVMISVSGLGIVYGLFRLIPWFEIFDHFYGDNAERAKIYILNDQHERVVNGRFYWMDNDYTYYHYLLNGRMAMLRRPVDFKDIFIRGRLKILVAYGSDIASPLYPSDVDVVEALRVLSPFDMNERFKPQLGVAMINALHSNKGLGLAGILLIVGILAVGIIGFMLWRNHSSKPPVTIPISGNTTVIQDTDNLSAEDRAILDQINSQK